MIISINGRDIIQWILDETIEIENHLHNTEKWIGAAATEVICKRIPAGYKVWAQIKNATNLATMNFLIGIHEYTV